MRRHAVLAAAAAVAGLAIANTVHRQAAGADWTRPRVVTANGITALYPRSWHAFAHGDFLVVSSFPIPQDWPDWEHKRVPDGGVYVVV